MEGSLPDLAPSGEVPVVKYSFAQMLTDQWQTVKAKNLLSKTILDELIRVVKGRISVEETYSKSLAKLSTPISNSYVSLTEAVVGFSSDILNKSVQHKEVRKAESDVKPVDPCLLEGVMHHLTPSHTQPSIARREPPDRRSERVAEPEGGRLQERKVGKH